MRLRRSVLSGPGITRKRHGSGFAFYDPDGRRIDDAATAARIKDLVIPPAWKKVWICPHANGHVQAVGTDAAGRRQYLYHQAWQEERAEEKFDRVLDLSKQLPKWRDDVAADLERRGSSRERVLALALHLLDRGYFRAGGEQYAEEHESYGLATLLREHVTLRAGSVAFDYPAKSGVQRTFEIEDPDVVRAIQALLRCDHDLPRLLVWRNGSSWQEVHADDLNARFKQLAGDQYSVKDLRTWHGTVLAAQAFANADPPGSERAIKRATAGVMKEVSAELGNTPAVARGSYVDPRVVAGYAQGDTIASAVQRAERARAPRAAQEILEKATRALIRRIAKAGSTSESTTARAA
ncbi:DNA topoisomerase IB [Mycobacterium sp. BK086]|uniref:DNA topoisomerase IB n=1 Tax=Mycobacterium sp. BK086 TaxID=2512165 RepID=UPI00105D7B25|nr:DNA topoisomerase IB [Mycobacterium sp. BK086]TDO18310.1 DNA topoisomerase IB [Mycobacterium sp. BK086]